MSRTFFIHIEEKSPLLRLHPLLKVVSLLVINLLAWIIDSPVALLCAIIAVFLSFKIFKIPLARIGKFIVFAVLIVQAVMLSYPIGQYYPWEYSILSFPLGYPHFRYDASVRLYDGR